jgi:hypothetical protein
MEHVGSLETIFKDDWEPWLLRIDEVVGVTGLENAL